jgi:beta-glucosidase
MRYTANAPLGLAALCVLFIVGCADSGAEPAVATLSAAGHAFRDLNKDGQLNPYEDSRLPVDRRVDDLLGRMTLEEKVGLMFYPAIGMRPDGSLVEDQAFYSQIGTTEAIAQKHINHVGSFIPNPPEVVARWCNNLQKVAEGTRLGIPVTICSDPRSGIERPYTLNNPCFPGVSHWPDPLGLAAARDRELVKRFGSIVAQEYRAVGITAALHPMADLATEPRWGRTAGTFGQDAQLAAECVAAYIEGFQGDSLGPRSVACVTKHFPGGGPQKDGWDCHYRYGKEQVYPGNNFQYHLIPFQAAIDAGTAQIMPYYAIPVGQTSENVGSGYSREIVTDLLRGKLGFDGVVMSDGGVISPYVSSGQTLSYAKCWGVEDLSIKERFKKAIDAGLDQFLVECTPEIVVELVHEGAVAEERIDKSARRILRDKFRLGLFDDPYVDPNRAKQICGSREFQAAADLAQRKSIVLLKNKGDKGAKTLPLAKGAKVFFVGVDRQVASQYATVVDDLDSAEVAVVRINAPFEHRNGPLEAIMHQGDLSFSAQELERIGQLMRAKPTVVCIYLDRAAVIPEIADQAAALLATFGSEDAALLDVLFGRFQPTGKLPSELPRSMEAVRNQQEDVPGDSKDPLFGFGFGLTYDD